MRRRCAWCGDDLGRKEPFDDDRRTDGICPPCSEQLLHAAEPACEPATAPQSWQELLLEVRAVAQTIEARVEKALAQD
jgi:hypothetical protein